MEKTQNGIISDAEAIAMDVSGKSIAANVLLSVVKLLAGLLAHSGAMISDAVHSLSDVFSTVIVMIGVKIANKDADTNHPYGHERFECIASIMLSVFLLFTGLMIGYNGVRSILDGSYTELDIPGRLALFAAILSIVVKEGMFQYTKIYAKKINSDALMADAWHHRSDALSSIGALVGIAMARAGFPIADPIASVIICLFIGNAAYEIFKSAVDKLVDKSCDESTEREMKEKVMNVRGVMGLSQLTTRVFGSRIYVDLEIECQGELSLNESHDIAEEVHDCIEENFPEVKHCMVHVNPV